MATTTNYGWTTPDDTALVKDGAAAIRTLGTSVDTTTKALNPSTTLGDIEYRSSTANTNTRLGIGSTGQVLTVAGGVPSWATPSGTLTLSQITTGNINSGTSVNISGLTQDTIQLHMKGITWGTGAFFLQVQPNSTSSAVYSYAGGRSFASGTIARFDGDAGTYIAPNHGGNQSNTNASNYYIITLTNCKAAGFTTYEVSSSYVDDGSNNMIASSRGIFRSAAQVTSLLISAGYTFNGTGTYTVYGG
jgi:hypothetical protein